MRQSSGNNGNAEEETQTADESTAFISRSSDIENEVDIGTAKFAAIFASLLMGIFFTALDMTVVVALLSSIGSEFDSLNAVSWIGTSYLIGTCVVQPLAGKLSDIYGRRICLILANLVFGLGCLGCGLSQTFEVLVISRAISGLGGGALNTLGSITLTDFVPLRKRGIYQGVANVLFGTGNALGGVYGGLIHEHIGWRMAFLIQVPFICLSTIVVALFVRIKPKESKHKSKLRRVDFLGSAVLVTSVGLLMFSLSTGGNQIAWNSPLILTCIPLSLVGIVLFWWVEKKFAAEPIIPMDVMRNRTVLAASIGNWFQAMAQMALTFNVPIFFSVVKGYTAAQVGVQIVTFAIATSVGSVSAGIIMLKGKYYWLTLMYCALMVIGSAAFAAFSATTPRWVFFVVFAIPGFAIGGILTTFLLAMIASVGREHQAVVISISYAFRSTGATIGVALGTAVFQSILWARLSSRLTGNAADKIIEEVRRSADAIKLLPEPAKGLVLQSYLDALRAVFVVIVGLSILGTLSAAFMKEHILHKTLNRT